MSEKLEPCPWCGEQPQEHYLQSVHYFYIKCDNFNCPSNPSVIGLTKNEAVERWNKRAKKTGTIKYQEFEDLCLNGNPIKYQLCSCSVCHVVLSHGDYNYCPNCGVRLVNEKRNISRNRNS